MPNIIKVKRSNTAGSTPSVSYGELAYNAADNRLFVGNAANVATVVGSGGGGATANIVEAATPAGFPAEGASNTLFISRDSSRVYRWDSSGVYIEIGN
jgi:hypothetical protein